MALFILFAPSGGVFLQYLIGLCSNERVSRVRLLFLQVLGLILVILSCSLSPWIYADETPAPKKRVTEGWQYHWGDLPRIETTGKWSFAGEQWLPSAVPNYFPGREQENIVWLKVDIPKGQWRDPYLFIASVDLTMQVFHQGRMIYHFGEINEQGESRFEGWPWHSIRLPEDYQEHPLYFRIYSYYQDIGLSGEVAVGERFDLLEETYRRGVTGLSFMLVVLLVGVITTAMGTIKKDRRVAVSTGVLSFDLALMMFAENELSQVVWFEPLVWRYVAAFCYFLVPVFLSIIVISWLRKEAPNDKPQRISKVAYGVFALSVGFVVGVAVLSAFTPFNFVNAYPHFDVLFIVMVLSLMIGCYRRFKSLGAPGVLMAFGILALFVSLILDMLSAHGMILWIGHAGQWGLVLFSIASLMVYLVQDWRQQISLDMLTQHLEHEVEMRTSDLQQSQRELERLAKEDPLTELLNRRAFTALATSRISDAIRENSNISLLLFDIDHFKEINDLYGHCVGDTVLTEIAKVTKSSCRDNDVICRYGGEEFVILLSQTDTINAEILATRVSTAIKNLDIQAENKMIHVTASFGLISLPVIAAKVSQSGDILERLLIAADKLMYEVKSSGRDGIKVWELDSNISFQLESV
ncbi:hypothetical protein A9Q99_08015 [Gammaproteobacteria bacterium 45_16_T64]|nr:hypothetical protein A9Q99_08015 [Gammaproteobacteria bacterium 45_16_T64]